MVGSKIIDGAMSLVTKGSLQRQPWHDGKLIFELLCLGHCSYPTQSQMKLGWKRRQAIPFQGVTLWGEGILLLQCQRPSLHHMEGHHPSIQHSKCAHQFQCQRTLYAFPCTHGTDTRSPVAYNVSTNSDLWRMTSRVLQGTYLSVQLEHPFCGNPYKDCGWLGYPCQPGATGSPPNKDFWGIQWQIPKGMGLGGPSPQGMTQTRAESGQKIAAQMENLFACSDLDLGKTALIKHKIEVTDQTLFKEQDQHIPPHMYDDMRAHIQEMLDIGAIQKSHRPWASTVVLVWKKDSSLRFCNSLSKLNNWTIKDAYLLPHIDRTLDSL